MLSFDYPKIITATVSRFWRPPVAFYYNCFDGFRIHVNEYLRN
ncbi:hypothetical protein B194_0964 [Serratia plymuthica A30]|nr:hypothetical protein B194_0964 [Serratia plymuthica A30]